jgi:TatD DNase family protein
MPGLIDTHTHLYLPEFDADRSAMLARARAVGVEAFYLPAIDSATHTVMIQLEQEAGDCKAMMGLHPCSVKENYKEELAIAEKWWEEQSFIAVGEIGLDFYWDRTFEKEQYVALRQQIEWAIFKNVPVVIHSRNATLACVQVVKEYTGKNLRGVFHCFSGSLEEAHEIMKLGFYLGIGGVLTYKNAGLSAVLEKLPLDQVILETDAPYLTPVPHRGKRNESAYITLVAEKLAAIKGISLAEVRSITSTNAKKLFGQQVKT